MNLPALPSQTEWSIIKEQASTIVQSKFLPAGIDTPEKAIAIALKGREMGVPMMQAFSHISIINGKPCMSAELMLAQVRKHFPNAPIDILEMNEKKCVIKAARKKGDVMTQFDFTMEKAVQAGLAGKGVWKQYPTTMLKWRAISEMARTLFPDALMGISYVPEEMGAEVDENGEVIDIPHNPDVSEKKEEPKLRAILTANEPKETEYVGTFGPFKGKKFSEVPVDTTKAYLKLIEETKIKENKPLVPETRAFVEAAEAFLSKETDDIPF